MTFDEAIENKTLTKFIENTYGKNKKLSTIYYYNLKCERVIFRPNDFKVNLKVKFSLHTATRLMFLPRLLPKY